jgi:hypothetical protein
MRGRQGLYITVTLRGSKQASRSLYSQHPFSPHLQDNCGRIWHANGLKDPHHRHERYGDICTRCIWNIRGWAAAHAADLSCLSELGYFTVPVHSNQQSAAT